ncbi:MAG TPA: phosphoribosylglycinamide formyltransferase [Acidimicrobiales bacterium]
MRLGVLASGSGTILEAIVESGLTVSVVVVDRPCRALDVAERAAVPALLVERDTFSPQFDRAAYTRRLVEALAPYALDLVAMAGFMTVLGGEMFEVYGGRVLNTHPSLLPSFPGAHAVREALSFGVKVTGCTVHVATETVDHGPILAQEAVPVLAGDTEASLHERIKAVERRLYPNAIKELYA